MSATEHDVPPLSGDRAGLAGEISDVIDEHGRGLDAERISSTIEAVLEVCGDGSAVEEVSHAELRRELRRFVEEHTDRMDREEILEFLREIAEDLQAGSLQPNTAVEQRDGAGIVELAFDCAFSLQRALPKLFDIRGYFIEANTAVAYVEEIRLQIWATRIDETVELDACVARTAPNGFTVQVWQPSIEVKRTLRELPRRMRAAHV